MRFLNPQYLPLLWLALLPVLLHLFRRRSRSVRVSTLLFFEALMQEHQENAWLRRLKRWLALLLSLLILTAPIFALARLTTSGRDSAARSVVILLDRSASMAATDAEGQTRLNTAREWLRAQLVSVPESVPIALLAYDGRAEILHPKSTNRRALLRTLDEVTVRPMEDDVAAALAAAGPIAALETPAEIWHLTDAAPAITPHVPEGVTHVLTTFPVTGAVNAGITALSVQKVPLAHGRYQAFVQVLLNAGADGPRQAVLEPRTGSVPLARRQLDLVPGEPQGVVFDLNAAQDQVLEVTLQLEGDTLPADNVAALRLPAARPLVVTWYSPKPDPFTELALKAIATDGELTIYVGKPEQWPPPQQPDAVILENWLPPQWPEGLNAIVLDPPGSSGPLHAVRLSQAVPREELRALDETHPVLFRLSTSRLTLTQTAVLDSHAPWQPLWDAGGQTVLMAGEPHGGRVVVLAGAPALSPYLPLTPSFPLLLANSLSWCTEKTQAARVPQLTPPGEVLATGAQALEWREWRHGTLAAPELQASADTTHVELDRLGLWRLADGSREGATALLSPHETNLGPAAAASGATAAPASPAPAPASRAPGLTGELTRWFILLALAVLLLESWLFHRHSVA